MEAPAHDSDMDPPAHEGDKDAFGRAGEEAAARYLMTLGWRVVARNWRCSEGEIDIVAHDGARHVVCEVKTRRSVRYGTPVEAVGRAKANRLWRLARRWAAENGAAGGELRVDVIGLVADGAGGFTIDHLQAVS